jgi:hypothetical protein
MEKFYYADLEGSFARFDRAAAKGHEESIWILSVVKDVEMEKSACKEAFAKTEEPLGWYFAGELSYDDGREAVEFWKKSAEGGCSWGQAWYAWALSDGEFVEYDFKAHAEWQEKAVNQNNPMAMYWLGKWFQHERRDQEKAVSYFRAAAELGWKNSIDSLTLMLRDGEGCERDLRQAVIWSAKEDWGKFLVGSTKIDVFSNLLTDGRRALESGATEDLGCEINQLCYLLGWGLYWYLYGSLRWIFESGKNQAFGNRCLDFYCSCVELQQKSIFTFLLFWNRTTGVKGPGQMIAQMVWEGREDNLVKPLTQPRRRSARLKRIKK